MSTKPSEFKEKLCTAIREAIKRFRTDDSIPKGAFTRERVLSLSVMVKTLLVMGGGDIAQELESLNIKASKAAFSQQRRKLSWTLFEDIFETFNSLCSDTQTYKGYRVFAVDGTAVNIATNPSAPSYMPNGTRKGYNQLHANIIYDVLNKSYQHCHIQPQPLADEVGALFFLLAWYDYPEKALVVADRGYESYNVFANFKEDTKMDFLIRVKQNKSAMREVRKLPMEELDVDISFTLTTTQTKRDKENGYIFIQTPKDSQKTYSPKTRMRRWSFQSPYNMNLRIVRIQLNTGEYETLATSLPRSSITANEIKELYHARWGIETSFRELKYGVGLEHLHGKSDEFAYQEIFASMIMSNFCSRIAQSIIIKNNNNNKLSYAVNRKMAIVLCRKYFADMITDDKELIRKIESNTEAVRPGRQNTRNLRAKSFSGFTYRIPT